MTDEALDLVDEETDPELLLAEIDKIDAAIMKLTDAMSKHDLARRSVSENRNVLAGAVHSARLDLEGILSGVKRAIG